MDNLKDREQEIYDMLCAQILGRIVLDHIRNMEPQIIAQKVNIEAVSLLAEIYQILNDTTVDDPECLSRIDRIVRAFFKRGLASTRHRKSN